MKLCAGVLLVALAAAGCHSSTAGTPTSSISAGPTTTGGTTVTSGPSCPPPSNTPLRGSAPLGYFRLLTLPGGVSVRFVAIADDVTLEVKRTGDCEQTQHITLGEGKSGQVFGVTLTVDRIQRSTGGKPPQIDLSYRLG